MAFSRPNSLALFFTLINLNLIHADIIPRDDAANITFPGTVCASPSCVVGLDSTQIVFTPSPVTLMPPEATESITVTFNPYTISSADSSTILSNSQATLTLGKKTISNLSATASQTYNISPTETGSVTVIEDISAVAQLAFDPNYGADSCPINASSAFDSRSIEKRKISRYDCTPDHDLRLRTWINDATSILQTVNSLLQQNDIAFTKYFLPSDYQTVMTMASSILNFLADPNIAVYFSCDDQHPESQARVIANNPYITAFATNYPNCNPSAGLVQFTPRSFENFWPLFPPTNPSGKNWCSDVTGPLRIIGGGCVIHELTHIDYLGKKVGLGGGTNPHDTPYFDEYYGPQDTQQLRRNNPDYALYNADNYAMAFTEFYLRILCNQRNG